ncbi:exosome complex component RRP4-like [Centruroides sculpturatus]|uniref:exosome complex component RRP4-like n=1 Tax=Centruroides sculpturatus TaxID=218467 RepID=UPI000C6E6074|nr:exosome complex component RRP4-like [Centruroides sculpturatus]
MEIDVRLMSEREKDEDSFTESKHLLTPGNVVVENGLGFMSGHGTYVRDDKLFASVAGIAERVNKLISVKPLKTRYIGEVGDVIIGRIREVQQKRWKVETNSKLDSILLLSSVNLPGGELRRKTADDEVMMKQFLTKGDLISAEVQSIFSDGSLSLHTRSLKYGKLNQGTLVCVCPTLVKRRKTHFHNLPCGAHIILGNNGYIWISPVINEDVEHSGGYAQCLEQISRSDRETIARLRNSIMALANWKLMLFDTSIQYAFEESLQYQIKHILKPENEKDIATKVQFRLDKEISFIN